MIGVMLLAILSTLAWKVMSKPTSGTGLAEEQKLCISNTDTKIKAVQPDPFKVLVSSFQ